MRKLVTLRQISEIRPIENADMIEEVVIDGWSMVCQKGIHEVGNDVLYFEIDSFLPQEDQRFESFMKFGTQTFEDTVGHRVKTKRMRGVYSQGVLMPIAEFPEITKPEYDVDYSELLNIKKYERPETGFQGYSRGNFPDFLRKSDQERIQNIYRRLKHYYMDKEFVGTLKMDGSSTTTYLYQDKFGICSRNMELELAEVGQEAGKFEQGVLASDQLNKLIKLKSLTGKEYAIQSELVGPGVQGNFEKFDTYTLFAYNIFDIEAQRFVTYEKFKELAELVDLQCVPVVYEPELILERDIEDILVMAEGKGLRANYREGIVWKQVDGNVQFKAISNKYLAKEK